MSSAPRSTLQHNILFEYQHVWADQSRATADLEFHTPQRILLCKQCCILLGASLNTRIKKYDPNMKQFHSTQESTLPHSTFHSFIGHLCVRFSNHIFLLPNQAFPLFVKPSTTIVNCLCSTLGTLVANALSRAFLLAFVD